MDNIDTWETLRVNLRRLMAHAKDTNSGKPRSVTELDEKAGVAKSSVYRLMKENSREPFGFDKLVAIAIIYELPAWALLVPGLNPAKPAVIPTEEEIEAEVQRRTLAAMAIVVPAAKALLVDDDDAGRGTPENPYLDRQAQEERYRAEHPDEAPGAPGSFEVPSKS